MPSMIGPSSITWATVSDLFYQARLRFRSLALARKSHCCNDFAGYRWYKSGERVDFMPGFDPFRSWGARIPRRRSIRLLVSCFR
jgi:hypothetical protein